MVLKFEGQLFILIITVLHIYGQDDDTCKWGPDEHVRRFVRVPEDAPVGSVAFEVDVSRPDLLKLIPIKNDVSGVLSPPPFIEGYGRILVGALLSQLVNEEDASSVLKFALYCGTNPVSQQVTIYIDDINNHWPVFLDENITITVDELMPTGLVVLPEIPVHDGDKPNTANSEVELSLESQVAFFVDPKDAKFDLQGDQNTSRKHRTSTRTSVFGLKTTKTRNSRRLIRKEDADYFALTDVKRGQIKLMKALDFDAGPRRFELTVVAKDMGVPSLSSTSVIQVTVKDSDDLDPRFTSKKYTAFLLEYPGPDVGADIRDRVKTEPGPIRAFDGDMGINATLRYSVIEGESSSYFSIDETTGDLYLVKHLDREKLRENVLTIHILATQIDNPSREASTEVSITVGDVNDHLPFFQSDVYSISIVENLPVGFSVVQVSASDPDEGENGEFTYYVKTQDTPLTVNPETGWLTVANKSMLDRELAGVLHLEVCTRQASPIAYLSREIVAEGRDLDLEATDDTLRRPGQTKTFANTLNPSPTEKPLKPIPVQATSPATIGVQSISPSVRSLSPKALLEKEKHLLNEHEPTTDHDNVEMPFHSRKENSFGRLLATRRMLSQVKAAKEHSPQGRTDEEENEHTGVEAAPTRQTREAKFRGRNNERENFFLPTDFLRFNDSLESPCASIRLTLLDANDNNPVFVPSNHYEFIIMDNIEVGEVVGAVKAIDNDSGVNGVVKYKLQKPSQESSNQYFLVENFDLDSRTGVLKVKSPVTAGQATLFVEGSDSPSSPSETRTTLAVVSLTIKPQNNLEPQFVGAPYEFWVGADAPIGTSVGQVKVTNIDDNKVVFDMFHTYDERVPFGIEETSGIVAVTKVLQDFTRPRYDLEAVVEPLGESSKYFELSTNVTIHVAPPPPSGTPRDITVTFSVPENLSGGKVGDILKALRDIGVRVPRDPRLQLVSPESRGFFVLNEEGVLYTVAPLDYETKTTHTLVIVSARTSLIFYVLVEVVDLNDNPPRFNAVRYEGSIQENALQGMPVKITPKIKVTDLDSYEEAFWTVYVIEEDGLFTFKKETNEVIFLGGHLDREDRRFYTLTLKAVDDGNLTSFANLTITLEDVNDNAPEFVQRTDVLEGGFDHDLPIPRGINIPVQVWNLTQGKDSILSIPEALPIGSRITQVLANDKDTDSFGKVEYGISMQTVFHLSSENDLPSVPMKSTDFAIDPKTGSILVAEKLTPNTFYLLNVTATDGGGLSSVMNIPVSVYDVNDNVPKFKEPFYTFRILEGEYVVSDVGKVLAEDEDLGENGQITYHMVLPPNTTSVDLPFRILESTGRILISGTVDREIQEKYEFMVKAMDGGHPSLSDSAKVEIHIEDVNDHRPEFLDYEEYLPLAKDSTLTIPLYRATIMESAPPGSIITKITAQDLDNSETGNGLVLYKLQDTPSTLAIDSQDGTIYTTGRLDYETEPILHAKIIAQDMAKSPLSSTSLLTVIVEDVVNELTARTFPQEVYEVHAFENSEVPERLARIQLDAKVTQDKTFHLRLVDSSMLSTVHLDPLSGDLLLIRPLDRELKSSYRFKIRAVEIHKGRSLSQMTYYEYKGRQNISDDITSFLFLDPLTTEASLDPSETTLSDGEVFETEASYDTFSKEYDVPDEYYTLDTLGRAEEVEALALDEAWIHLIVNDLNDNAPEFIPSALPIVAAVSSSAMFGDKITTVRARDIDEGINSEIHYEIVPTTISSKSISYFALDVVTGELKVAGDLLNIVGEMVSFDIRATDKNGEADGQSSTTSAFIHVLGEASQLVIELNAAPTQIYPYAEGLQSALANITGYEILIQKIAPHVDGDVATIQKSDVFIFGVDPLTKELIPSKLVRASLRHRQHKISAALPREISMQGIRTPLPHATEKYLKSAELAILVGALVVFLACISAIVCLCYRQRKSRRKPMPLPSGLNLNMAASNAVPILPLPYNGQYPAPYTHMSDHSDSSDSTHVPPTDAVHVRQMAERMPRQSFARAYSRPQEASHRTGRGDTTVTHIDDDNWQCRARRHSNGNEAEDETCGHVHTCNHNSPNFQRSSVSSSRWHVRECTPERDGDRGNVRVIHQGNRSSIRHTHNPCCGEGCSRGQGNSTTSCAASTRPATPDSLERNQSRTVHREVPAVVRAINHRKSNGRLTNNVTEL